MMDFMTAPFHATRDDVLDSLVQAYCSCMLENAATKHATYDWSGWVIENMDMGALAEEAREHPDYAEIARQCSWEKHFIGFSELPGFGLAGVTARGAVFRNVSFKTVPLSGDFSGVLFEDCDLREQAFGIESVLDGVHLVRPKLTILNARARKGVEIVDPTFYTPEFDSPGGGERIYGFSETPEGKAVYVPTLSERFSNIRRHVGIKNILDRYANPPDGEAMVPGALEALQRTLPDIVIDMIEKQRGAPIADRADVAREIGEEMELSRRTREEKPADFLRRILSGKDRPKGP